MINKKPTISTIIRFHDVNFIGYLERALQSLHSQIDVAVSPIIVLQRFSDDDYLKVEEIVNKNWYFKNHLDVKILNFIDGKGHDARSDLLNLGIEYHFEVGNRFLGFLDYDDILYSHAYKLLSSRLLDSGAVISFASIELAHVLPLNDYDFIHSMSMPFFGKNKLDLLKDNFCPLHSYLIDTEKLDKREVYFRSNLNRVEDYEFLLRIAGKNPCSFRDLGKKIGCYFMRSNGSNTTPDGYNKEEDKAKQMVWKENLDKLNSYRADIEIKFFASDF